MSSKIRNRASLDADAVARMMAAQDLDEQDEATAAPAEDCEPEAGAPAALPSSVAAAPESAAPPPAFDPGKIDGRTLRRTGREPFATRIKPETHEALKRIAYARRITIAEAVELAVEALERS